MNYLYRIKFPKYEAELCQLEMRQLFAVTPEQKHFFSSVDVRPTRSIFIKERMSIRLEAATFAELVEAIRALQLYDESFKVFFFQHEDTTLSFKERTAHCSAVGWAIEGECELKQPRTRFAITEVAGRWYFGDYEDNDLSWHQHDEKPFTYSHSLSIRDARAIVNIAMGQRIDATLIDPCCGVGTVVIEALSLGIDVKGNEINRAIAYNAKRNVAYFGYDNVITCGDMHDITERYDVAIVDIPYGVFIPITREQQVAIIETARRIADRLVIVTFEDMDEYVTAAGFTIVDQCTVTKGQFKRYISVCH